jgi:hypothetical protein
MPPCALGEVISSTDTGAQVMGALPGLVRRLLDEKAWMDFTTPDGHHVSTPISRSLSRPTRLVVWVDGFLSWSHTVRH